MAERHSDYVILSDEERVELGHLETAIPAAIARAGALFTERTMKEFIEADRESGRLIKRWKELIGV